MTINGWSRVFRRRSSVVRGSAAQDQEELRISAAMAHVQEQGNLDGFAGSRSERLALMATAMRRGLVAWNRSRDRYVLSALGRRYLEIHASRPRSAGRRSERRRAGRLMAAGVAALGCLGLVAVLSNGPSPIKSYLAHPMPAAVEAPSPTPSAPADDGARMLARADAPLARPEQAEAGAEPVSEQTAVAPSVEPATRETVTAKAEPQARSKETKSHRRHHAQSSRWWSARSHRGFEPRAASGYAQADPYRYYRGWNSFGRSNMFGFYR